MADRKRRVSENNGGSTLDDVAELAGASRTAVSFVLNEKGERNKHVSEETRTRILQAIAELNFQPDQLARTLRKGRNVELVGILDTALTSLGIEVMSSLQQQALQYGYTPVMYASQGLSAQQRSQLYRTIFARRPRAIITTPHHFSAADVAQAYQASIEHVVFFSFQQEPLEHTHSIIFPSAELGALAAEHLIARGHTRLALVRPDDPIHLLQDAAFAQRLEGMRAVIGAREDVTLDILPLRLAADAAQRLVDAAFVGDAQPTGIYSFNDEYGLLLLGALARRGIRVPEQVAVIGTDNLAVGAYVWPSLTSIRIDGYDIGKRTVDLIRALDQGSPMSEDLTQPLQPILVLRGST